MSPPQRNWEDSAWVVLGLSSPKNLATWSGSYNNSSMNFLCLKAPEWERREGLLHGFLGRRGGKSAGAYAGLNLSFRVGDDPQVVKDNFCDMKREVGVHDLRIVTMKQVHGERIIEVKDNRLKEVGEADGMITEEKGLFLGVLTADCVPMLFSVRGRKLAAVAHAGWRGTLAGIAAKMIGLLKERHDVDPSSVEAAMGPAIGPCCYEVDDPVLDQLRMGLPEWESVVRDYRGHKARLDLKALIRRQAEEQGVPASSVSAVNLCTICQDQLFYSYRREGRVNGTMVSGITLFSQQ